eukprot:GHVL01035675.1.p1 GENE.GHVL01035675.1~~GHVL01035675.1.p1  ORF type:complete len:138 (+),score=24.80 GHVL01035675.1:202-615(+)
MRMSVSHNYEKIKSHINIQNNMKFQKRLVNSQQSVFWILVLSIILPIQGWSAIADNSLKRGILHDHETEFFKKLRVKEGFIDKSLMIKKIIEEGSGVTLLTRPRRWGKSLNMNMLKTFLEIEVDGRGKPLPADKHEN